MCPRTLSRDVINIPYRKLSGFATGQVCCMLKESVWLGRAAQGHFQEGALSPGQRSHHAFSYHAPENAPNGNCFNARKNLMLMLTYGPAVCFCDPLGTDPARR